MKRMQREGRRLRTYLGRIVRDIERKAKGIPEDLVNELDLAKRLLFQKHDDKNKLYSLHEPQVACISKGKAHKKYEFGKKVSFCITKREGFIIGVDSLVEGNPCDGHTLQATLDQTTQLTGTRPERCYVDRGYRGHGVTQTKVFLSGQRRNVTSTIKKELKRGSATEAIIGHQKTEGRLDRNTLRGILGDQMNALLTEIGYNLKMILRLLSFCCKLSKS